MNRVTPSRIVLLALTSICLARAALGAGWGRDGHGKITQEAAQSSVFGIGMNPDVAKVMALGSIAPDYFDYDNPAAHSQTPNPSLQENGALNVSAETYKQMQRDAYSQGDAWHNFYMNAAVTAMQHGNRERAAFLLGYALHNREDFATHHGMPDLLHSGLEAAGKNPDENRDNLASARQLAAIDLARFKDKIGADNWQLFNGQTVHHHNEIIVPEPMLTLSPTLGGWDPASGRMPAAHHETMQRISDAAAEKLGAVLKFVAPETAAKIGPIKEQIENFACGLYGRQEEMVSMLDVSSLGIARDDKIAAMPHLKDFDSLLEQIYYAERFAVDIANGKYPVDLSWASEPLQYQKLSEADRGVLGGLIWDQCLRDDLNKLLDRRRQIRQSLGQITEQSAQLSLAELRDARQKLQNKLILVRAQQLDQQAAIKKWQQATQTASATPPQVDGRPPPEPAYTYTESSESESDEPESRSSRSERSDGAAHTNHIDFHSDTFNYLKGLPH